MPTFYALAPGHNNTGGYIPTTALFTAHVTSFGSFEWGIEREYLDSSIEDSGTGRFEWLLSAGMTPSEVGNVETDILDGQRTGPVTVSTRLNNGTWVDCNATLALPRTFTPQGVRYGQPVLTFTGVELI